ncbi:copper-binding periplasmic metallochaperone CueP [Acerihabitans sp. KWT182]|uniref:Copper-binding periplasmic metallochaperone CueP n=1 Tax=Acerihabitans sp. KWT182 TaxID=3157919 RepID=A0AAU7QA33_9GAMM
MKNVSSRAINATILASALAAFSHGSYAQDGPFLAKYGLDHKTTPQMVEYINRLKQDRPLTFSASVTSTDLTVSEGGEAHSYPLGDKFYLSFAPYITYTHPCYNHSLSSCTGELKNTTFKVKIIDQKGHVIASKNMTSYQNGFIGVWLPRNISGTVQVTHQGLSASTPFATDDDSQTCLTNLKLEKTL